MTMISLESLILTWFFSHAITTRTVRGSVRGGGRKKRGCLQLFGEGENGREGIEQRSLGAGEDERGVCGSQAGSACRRTFPVQSSCLPHFGENSIFDKNDFFCIHLHNSLLEETLRFNLEQ